MQFEYSFFLPVDKCLILIINASHDIICYCVNKVLLIKEVECEAKID